MEVVKEGKGLVVTKSEAKTKELKPYWLFEIKISGEENTKKFGWFEYKAGEPINEGDWVSMIWTEVPGTGKHGPMTYRNIKSTTKIERDQEELPKANKTVADYNAKQEDKYLFGQSLNLASDWALAHKNDNDLNKIEHWFDKIYAYAQIKRKEKLNY